MMALRSESGSALIEFALLVPLFVVILVGIANYAFLIEQKIQLQEAAAAGAAYGTIPGKATDVAGMIAAAKTSAPQFNTTMTVTAADVYSCSPGGGVVSSSATCGTGGPLLFVQVTTSATEFPVLKYTGMPTSLTMQGFASFEVVP